MQCMRILITQVLGVGVVRGVVVKVGRARCRARARAVGMVMMELWGGC